jgi:hypothetical protein
MSARGCVSRLLPWFSRCDSRKLDDDVDADAAAAAAAAAAAGVPGRELPLIAKATLLLTGADAERVTGGRGRGGCKRVTALRLAQRCGAAGTSPAAERASCGRSRTSSPAAAGPPQPRRRGCPGSTPLEGRVLALMRSWSKHRQNLRHTMQRPKLIWHDIHFLHFAVLQLAQIALQLLLNLLYPDVEPLFQSGERSLPVAGVLVHDRTGILLRNNVCAQPHASFLLGVVPAARAPVSRDMRMSVLGRVAVLLARSARLGRSFAGASSLAGCRGPSVR